MSKTVAIGRDLLAKQDRPAIAQHGEMPELMSGIGLCNRLCTVRS